MLTQEKYFKILPFVWVCKFRSEINKPSNVHYSSYRFSKDMPKPVANKQMCWQKPLYSELIEINDRMMREARKNIYGG